MDEGQRLAAIQRTRDQGFQPSQIAEMLGDLRLPSNYIDRSEYEARMAEIRKTTKLRKARARLELAKTELADAQAALSEIIKPDYDGGSD